MRQCGDCNACCHVSGVRELRLRAFHVCPHVRDLPEIPGCRIYERRPDSCRFYKCLWLYDEQITDEYKPNRCGVVFSPDPEVINVGRKPTPVLEAYPLPGYEDAYKEFVPLFNHISNQGYAVLWRLPAEAEGRPERCRIILRDADGRFALGPICDTDTWSDERWTSTEEDRNRMLRSLDATRMAQDANSKGGS